GQVVEVSGNRQIDGTILALSVRKEPTESEAGNDTLINGTITAKDDLLLTITVEGVEIHASADGNFRGYYRGIIPFSGLQIGDYVRVQANTTPPVPAAGKSIQTKGISVLYATSIQLSDQFFVRPTPPGTATGDYDDSGCTEVSDFLFLLDNW